MSGTTIDFDLTSILVCLMAYLTLSFTWLEVGDVESSEEKQGILSQKLSGATVDPLQEAASTDAHRAHVVAGKQ